ncbi:hypothetical protein DRO61_00245 [Candidatus Bathyarchaeota archaeon]|nr:MAG: hypothetical protein DRO61_00245 [Candidatus Bathyarchaeota archaeon]
MPKKLNLKVHPIIKQYKYLRHKKGITQDEICDLVGVSKQSIANYETGRQIPSILVMSKLIVAVGAEGMTIYGWED